MLTKTLLLAIPLTVAGLFTGTPAGSDSTTEATAAFHPHFPKILECRVTREVTVKLRYQTVTFDADGAEEMKPGGAWHLAGATFETSSDLVVGGCEVPAGTYALSARKVEDGKWELVLHEGRGFSTKITEDAHVLETSFATDAPLFEHMNIDIQPAGDKEHTHLHLEVRFDRWLASALIEVPE